METLPFSGELNTYGLSAGPGPDYPPNYVPDSAPTATAWSTGKKTIDARLSQGPSAAESIPGSNAGYRTTFEIADKRGMRVGNVSTAEITDATPAAPSSHISLRACQGPADARTICPTEAKGSRRARLDRRAAGRPPARRQPRWRPQPLPADARRQHRTRWSTTPNRKGYRYVETASEPERDHLARQRSGARPLQHRQHDHGVQTADRRDHAGRRRPDVPLRRDQPAGERAEPGGDDQEGDRAAGEPQGLLPAGRGSLDRQARSRLRRLRPDRREPRLRQGGRRRPRLPEAAIATRSS